ncbi:MAG: enoyl-CoA hydratase/isomerase family protein, partial [Candidatus Marinimicrobia bacterium]|nr:enoyl-CoA hydratase/isomerase family protein [Candidatus Neomarinimicrobiota bacterium]
MFKYDKDEQGIGTVTLDLPDAQFNILSEKHFADFEALLDKLASTDEGLKGLIIISGKADNFIVGADIKDFLKHETVEATTNVSRVGQRILRKIAQLPFPTVAAINGACMGGGTELVLNCRARIITDHPDSSISLPEVNLGLLPG